MHNVDAYFDVFAIVFELGPPFGGVSRLEIQRAAYLACLVALYDGRPTADWGYKFIRTDFGTPYSAAINDALDALSESGRLSVVQGRFCMAPRGEALSTTIMGMQSQADRGRYLHAACGSALIVPASTFSEAVDNEPTVRRALHREKGGSLLEGPALMLLHQHFDDLHAAVPRSGDDLLTPSVVWLSYVSDQAISRRDITTPDAQ